MRIVSWAPWLAIALFAAPASANDSSAQLGAGGLELSKAADIRMASEDLRISPDEIRIRYEFVNDAPRDIDTIVAFPLPDIDTYEFYEEPLGRVGHDPLNFVDFEILEDGAKVALNVEQHAVFQGRDVTALLRSIGAPVNIVAADFISRLDHLKQKARLKSADLIEMDGDDVHPRWTVRTRFYWRQHFPAAKTIVLNERYRPVTGQSYFGASDLGDKEQSAYYDKNYCLDAPTRIAIGRRLAMLKSRGARDEESYLAAFRTDYILMTARNWKGPIGRFHLTIDKLRPENLISLCWDGDLKRTGATTFETTRENFAPSRDLKLLVLQQPSMAAEQRR